MTKIIKEDNQTLNQDEFIRAMNRLFENISSIERRQLINEYNNRRQKNNYINNYNKNINKERKNNSLIKKESINNKRMITRSYMTSTTDNNDFDNNYFSCRPKTPIYNKIKKNNTYSNYFNSNKMYDINNKKSQKTIVNNNTNKLAHKHFMRIQKMMNDYNNKYKNKYNYNDKNIKNNGIFDVKHNFNSLVSKIPKDSHRSALLNENGKFSSINDCTFNNYLKSLN